MSFSRPPRFPTRRFLAILAILGSLTVPLGAHADVIELTNGERAVLIELARAYPGLTSRTVLDRRPDQDRDVSSNVTEVLVARLRRKIEAAGGGVEIHAVRRSGYVLRPLTAAAVAPY